MHRERRSSERHPIFYVAWVDLGDGTRPRSCILSDVSTGGARLTRYAQEFPDQFDLWLSGNGWLQRPCRIAWRSPDAVGVEFSRPLRPQDVAWMFRVAEAQESWKPDPSETVAEMDCRLDAE